MTLHLFSALRASCAAAALAGLAGAQSVEFFQLPGTFPTSVNADGSIVVGDDNSTSQYFEWTSSGGVVSIGGAVAGNGIGGNARISADGSFVGGTELNSTTGLYEFARLDRSTGAWTTLGGLGGSSGNSTGSGWGISGDGQTVVGLGWINAGEAHAAQWTPAGGTIDLGSTIPGESSRANQASADGTVVAGWQDGAGRQGAVWINGVQTLISSPLGAAGEGSDVSADGQVVVGNFSGNTNNQPWRWTQSSGYQELGTLGTTPFPFPQGFATATNADGSIVVGFERGFGPPTGGEGFIWTAAGGIEFLDDYAAARGFSAPDNFRMSLPLDISDDGLTIVGAGRSDTTFSTGFVLRLPADSGGKPTFGVSSLAVDNPGEPALGDINGDGILDAVVPDGSNNAYVVLQGVGDGTFTTAQTLASSATPLTSALGDIDNDGDLDILGGNSGGRIESYLNNGLAGFTKVANLPTGILFGTPPDPIDLYVADFNADGNLDVAAALFFLNGYAICFGAGDGNFTQDDAQTVAGIFSRTIAGGDFDNDGDADLVTGGLGTDMVILENIAGAFTQNNTLAGIPGWKVRSADMDSDGNLDLVVSSIASDGIQVLLGNGDLTFGAPLFTDTAEPYGLELIDIDGDGDIDVFATEAVSERAIFLTNDGSGNLTLEAAFAIEADALDIKAGDLNGDGAVDAFVPNNGSDSVSVLLNAGPATFCTLGNALAGSNTFEPLLTGLGDLSGGSTNSIELSFAIAGAPTVIVAGFSRIDLPLLGGVLVPSPDLVLAGPTTDGLGNASLSFTLPAMVMPGRELHVQQIVVDAAAGTGIAASNAILGVTP